MKNKNSKAHPVCHHLRILIALKTAMRATPTSANTASHIVASPRIPSPIKDSLTARAKIMFCQTILCVLLAILMPPRGSFELVVHYDNVCSLYCRVASEGTHCNANVCPGQDGSVVYAVPPDEDNFTVALLLLKILYDLHLVLGGEAPRRSRRGRSVLLSPPPLPCYRP